MDNISLIKSLPLLNSIFPVKNVLMVGAGSGQEPYIRALKASNFQSLLCVEIGAVEQSSASSIKQLPGKSEDIGDKQKTVAHLIAPSAGRMTFYQVANSPESSLIPPEDLTDLWPNIRLRASQQLDAITIDEVIDRYGVHPDWLVVDCLPGVDLLKGAMENLATFNVVVVRMVMDVDKGSLLSKFSVEKTAAFFREHNFVCVGVESERHPKLARGLFVRDFQATLQSSNQKWNRLTRGVEKIASVVTEQRQLVETIKTLFGEGISLDDATPSSTPELDRRERPNAYLCEDDTLDEVYDVLHSLAEEMKLELKKLIKNERKHNQLSAQMKTGEKSLLRRMDVVEKSVLQNMERVRTRVGDDVDNLKLQLESYMGIQYFFQTAEFLPQMHGWPISPDFAVYLMELISYGDYDVILEYGSGSSTLLMAQTLNKLAKRSDMESSRHTIQVAFEHLEKYHSSTLKLLQQVGMTECVQLCLTPLVDGIKCNGESYRYYSCIDVLKGLAERLNGKSQLNIFMLVDGPPALTGRLARYPAVPLALEWLGKTAARLNLDILLDDYQREDEKKIADLWMKDIAAFGGNCILHEKALEKDGCLIRCQIDNATASGDVS